mgnify:CR=1 FL=1
MRVSEPRGDIRKAPGPGLGLSRRALGFSILAAALSAAGIFRAELGALVCGAGLGAAVLSSLAGVLIEGRRRDRALAADPESLGLSLSQASRDGNPELQAVLRIENRKIPLPRAPGVSAWVSFRGVSRTGRVAFASVALPASGASLESPVPGSGSLRRGVYRGRAVLTAGDAFGFWTSRRELPGVLETAAFPEPEGRAPAVPRGSGGDRPDPSYRRILGEDRFDSRPYFPGDDPRRLHWKLYARFGDLFVRPGDLTPPPRRTVRILLDTERPGFLLGEAGDDYLDALVAAALEYALYLENRGLAAQISAPGLPEAPSDPAGRLYWLADLAWGSGGEVPSDPGPEPLAVFGAPGAVRRGALLAERKSAGCDTVLIFPNLPELISAGFWTRAFLVPETGSRRFGEDATEGSGSVGSYGEPGTAFRAAFREALDREVRELSDAGGFDVRVL